MKEKSLLDDKRIFGLDVLRVGALLMVMISHLLLFFPNQNIITTQLAPLSGFLGVEILLILSGFLVGNTVYTMMVLQDKLSWTAALQYLKHRAWRILPNYYLVLLIAIAIAFWFHYADANVWKYFFFIQNFASPMSQFFPESWSIAIGFFGNVLLILGMYFIFSRFRFQNKSKAFLVGIVLMIMISLACKLGYYMTNQNTELWQWDKNLKAVVIYRLDSFFIGSLCSWIYLNHHELWIKYKKMFVCFGLLLMVLMFVGVGYFQLLIDSNPFFWKVLYLPITSIAIAFFLPIFSQWNLKGMWNDGITFMSKISYAVYLLHYTIILQLMNHFFNPKSTTIIEFCFFSLGYFIITSLSGFVLFRFIQNDYK